MVRFVWFVLFHFSNLGVVVWNCVEMNCFLFGLVDFRVRVIRSLLSIEWFIPYLMVCSFVLISAVSLFAFICVIESMMYVLLSLFRFVCLLLFIWLCFNTASIWVVFDGIARTVLFLLVFWPSLSICNGGCCYCCLYCYVFL